MAIVRTAGSEIIRTAHFEDVDNTLTKLIVGEKDHIYTVLSVIFFCHTLQASGLYLRMLLNAYDSKAGDTNQDVIIFENTGHVAKDTFVWDNKFSFNGYEPTSFTGPMDDATKQNAVADQGSSVAQYLACQSEGATDQYEVTVTYIDQNNA